MYNQHQPTSQLYTGLHLCRETSYRVSDNPARIMHGLLDAAMMCSAIPDIEMLLSSSTMPAARALPSRPARALHPTCNHYPETDGCPFTDHTGPE